MQTTFNRRHLLGIRDLNAGEIVHLLDTAETFRDVSRREIKKVPALRGRTVINLFFESSTRTRTSFEIAAKRLSADAVNVSVSTSSVTKGETLLDTARNTRWPARRNISHVCATRPSSMPATVLTSTQLRHYSTR
jgi:aspartate carbamoyltransferase catalytic subunit